MVCSEKRTYGSGEVDPCDGLGRYRPIHQEGGNIGQNDIWTFRGKPRNNYGRTRMTKERITGAHGDPKRRESLRLTRKETRLITVINRDPASNMHYLNHGRYHVTSYSFLLHSSVVN